MKNLPSLSENFRYFLSGVFLCGLVLGSPRPSNSVVGPPSYLLIDGHDKCLSKFRASESHEEVCIPLTKPAECDEVVWAALADDFQALSPPQLSPNRPLPSSYDFEMMTDNIEAPAWTQIDGYRDCLISERLRPQRRVEVPCLPPAKPEGCTEEAWTCLSSTEVLPCERREMPSQHVNACFGKQEYVYMMGREQKDCVPHEKPIRCVTSLWQELQRYLLSGYFKQCSDSPIYVDDVVYSPTVEASAWTRIEGHRDCLVHLRPRTQRVEVVCLPLDKPERCSVEAWLSLFSTDVLPCERGEMPPLLHPAYEIADVNACFGKQKYVYLMGCEQKDCIPHEKPIRCVTSSWQQLQRYLLSGDFNQCSHRYIYVHDAVYLPTVDSLPQDHLSASGFTKIEGVNVCLCEHLVNNVRESCIGSNRPPGCPERTWEHLRFHFSAGHLKFCRSQEDVAFVPSKFHNVPGFTGCITFDNTNFKKCLPVTQPAQCEYLAYKMMRYLAFQTTESETGTSTTTDTIEMVRCNSVQDCEQHIVGNKQCSPLGNSRGVCAPQNCDQSGKCPKIGTLLINGQVTGQCNDSNMCVYASAIMIA